MSERDIESFQEPLMNKPAAGDPERVDVNKIFSIVHRQSQVFHTHKLKRLGLTGGNFMYVVCICECPGMTQDQLASKLQIDKGTVAKTLQQLLGFGFITRHSSAQDRRANQLYPTEKALEAYPKILEVEELWKQHILGDFSEDEAELFLRLLKKLPSQQSELLFPEYEDH